MQARRISRAGRHDQGPGAVQEPHIVGRPLVTIARSDMGKSLRDLRCENISRHSVLIRRVWSYPRWLHVSADDSLEGIVRARMRERFAVAWALANGGSYRY